MGMKFKDSIYYIFSNGTVNAIGYAVAPDFLSCDPNYIAACECGSRGDILISFFLYMIIK